MAAAGPGIRKLARFCEKRVKHTVTPKVIYYNTNTNTNLDLEPYGSGGSGGARYP